MSKSLLPNKVKVNISIDDIRLRSNRTTNKTIRLTIKIFFYTIQRFTQCHSGPLSNFEGFVHLIPGIQKSNKPINITGIDKIHLKCNCFNGSNVNGIREPILYSLVSLHLQFIKFIENLD